MFGNMYYSLIINANSNTKSAKKISVNSVNATTQFYDITTIICHIFKEKWGTNHGRETLGLRLRMLPSHYWKFEETSCYCTLGNQFLPSRVSSRLQTADDCKMNLYVSQMNRILYLVDISEKSYTLNIYNMYTIYLILLEKMIPFFPLF